MSISRRIFAVLVTAFVLTGVSPGTASAVPGDSTFGACPQLTHSLLRLYSAYFLRAPDAGGFGYWLGIYSGPSGGLETMSNVFADSKEFRQTYGALNNSEFVSLVYNNVMDRAPDAAGLAHWTSVLDRGL